MGGGKSISGAKTGSESSGANDGADKNESGNTDAKPESFEEIKEIIYKGIWVTRLEDNSTISYFLCDCNIGANAVEPDALECKVIKNPADNSLKCVPTKCDQGYYVHDGGYCEWEGPPEDNTPEMEKEMEDYPNARLDDPDWWIKEFNNTVFHGKPEKTGYHEYICDCDIGFPLYIFNETTSEDAFSITEAYNATECKLEHRNYDEILACVATKCDRKHYLENGICHPEPADIIEDFRSFDEI